MIDDKDFWDIINETKNKDIEKSTDNLYYRLINTSNNFAEEFFCKFFDMIHNLNLIKNFYDIDVFLNNYSDDRHEDLCGWIISKGDSFYNNIKNKGVNFLINYIKNNNLTTKDYFYESYCYAVIRAVSVNIDLINSIKNIVKNDDIVNKSCKSIMFIPFSFLIKSNIKNFDYNENECIDFYKKEIEKDWNVKSHIICCDNYENLLKEILSNINNKNYLSCFLLLNVFLELIIKNTKSYVKSNHRNNIYNSYKKLIKIAFDYKKSKNGKLLYNTFIKNNLYNNTNNDITFSRHCCHGEKLYTCNLKSVLNMIFICDFIIKMSPKINSQAYDYFEINCK